jgi:hypothetical protein
MFNTYDFTNRSSLERFDSDLTVTSFVFGAGCGAISLVDAFDNYYEGKPKVLYQIIDLKLCLFNLLMSVRDLERMRSRRDLADIFGFNRAWFGFVTLYRSFYDKFMNTVILSCYETELKSFESAPSKKKKFRKILESSPSAYVEEVGLFINFPQEFVVWMNEFISIVDDQYRTAEVHGAGMARKWIFSENDLGQTPYRSLGQFIDHIAQFFDLVACIASGEKYAKSIDPNAQG